jgi:hypothetical protein
MANTEKSLSLQQDAALQRDSGMYRMHLGATGHCRNKPEVLCQRKEKYHKDGRNDVICSFANRTLQLISLTQNRMDDRQHVAVKYKLPAYFRREASRET